MWRMRQAVLGITARAGHAVPAPGADELANRWAARLTGSEDASAHRCLSAVETSDLAWSFLHPLARGLAPSNRLAERAMVQLTERWQDPPQLAELARQLHVSREHLARVLRTTCGQAPGLWLRRYRIEAAGEMLLAGQTIQQTASDCSFCSAPHFIHAFRCIHGTTPGRWLREKQA